MHIIHIVYRLFLLYGNTYKSMALTDLFGRLSHSLIRANARAILSRSYSHFVQQVDELCA